MKKEKEKKKLNEGTNEERTNRKKTEPKKDFAILPTSLWVK